MFVLYQYTLKNCGRILLDYKIWIGPDLNQRPPQCECDILTRLDYRSANLFSKWDYLVLELNNTTSCFHMLYKILPPLTWFYHMMCIFCHFLLFDLQLHFCQVGSLLK